MRTASSTAETNTLPSPILPVLAALTMAATAASDLLVGHDEFDFDLRQEIHGVFAAAVDFGVALLAAESLDFGDGHAFDAEFAEGVFDFLELERLDDGFDFLHSVFCWLARAVVRTSPPADYSMDSKPLGLVVAT